MAICDPVTEKIDSQVNPLAWYTGRSGKAIYAQPVYIILKDPGHYPNSK